VNPSKDSCPAFVEDLLELGTERLVGAVNNRYTSVKRLLVAETMEEEERW
jgi:hypothetical protein